MPAVDTEAIKARYLGAPADKKKRTRKQNDKKFNFDWDQEDDTGAGELDPLYRNLQSSGGQSMALFGRGRLAGFSEDAPVEPSAAGYRPSASQALDP